VQGVGGHHKKTIVGFIEAQRGEADLNAKTKASLKKESPFEVVSAS
jgi:hypothetical protein